MIKKSKTICLNMIVKNEAMIVPRLFNSVIGIIDCYCICDTGSTDETVTVIKNYFQKKGIPGKIVTKEFVDFGFNRTYALEQARQANYLLDGIVAHADYALLLDADMVLKVGDFDKTVLEKDAYYVLQGNDGFRYYNLRLVSLSADLVVKGPTHEHYDFKGAFTRENLPASTLVIDDLNDGGSRTDKFERDVRLLTKALKDEPDNPRYHFYLANSFFDLGRPLSAIEYYLNHLKLANWDEEIFYSHYRLGLCYLSKKQEADAIYHFTQSYNVRPTRMEGLYQLVKHYRIKGQHHLADLYYQQAKKIRYPHNDTLFIHKDIYNWRLDFEYSIVGYYLGEADLSHLYLDLMNRIPNYKFVHLMNNYKFYKKTVKPIFHLNFGATVQRKLFGGNCIFKSSSSSIVPIKKGDKGYLLNVRFVNYKIDQHGQYSYSGGNGKQTITLNQACLLTSDLEVKSTHFFSLLETDPDLLYYGVEDVKLFQHGDDVLFTGTVFRDKIGIAYGKYSMTKQTKLTGANNVEEGKLDHEAPSLKPIYLRMKMEKPVEKNWVFVPDHPSIRHLSDNSDNEHTKRDLNMVYSWSPLKIGTIRKDCLVLTREIEMPPLFRHVRGSTNGVIFEEEIWFIVHIVAQNDGEARYYYHMLVVFDFEMNFKRCTVPFQFHPVEQIQYCLGLVVEKDRLIITHSNWDRETHIGVYTHQTFDQLWSQPTINSY